MADVTARVIDLLRAKPGGFVVNAQSVGADPLPGKRKRLTVRYDYKGREYVFAVSAPKSLSYQTLLRHASK